MVTRLDTILFAGSPDAGVPAQTLKQYADLDGDYAEFTYRDDAGQTRVLRVLLPEQPAAFQRRAAYKASLPFTAADFLDATRGASSMSEVISLVTQQVVYTAFWQPDDQRELGNLRLRVPDSHAGMVDPRVDHLPFFSPAEPLTVYGVDGYMWVSKDNTRLANVIGGRWIMSTAGALFPPFPRRVAAKLPADADDPDVAQVWTAADFTGADSSISYSRHIADVTRVSGSPDDRYHKAYWVPDGRPDIDDVLQADARAQQPGLGGGTGFSFLYQRQAGTVTVDGVVGKVWGTTRVLNPFDPATLAYAYLLIIQTPEA